MFIVCLWLVGVMKAQSWERKEVKSIELARVDINVKYKNKSSNYVL